jgi:hypothetical protein
LAGFLFVQNIVALRDWLSYIFEPVSSGKRQPGMGAFSYCDARKSLRLSSRSKTENPHACVELFFLLPVFFSSPLDSEPILS